jgi:predicted N-acyltransferase
LTYQFHWQNERYESFEHYLSGFRSQVRKQIRKERRLAAESGLRLATKPGTELTAEEWRVLELVYRRTIARKGGFAYLTPEFFEFLRGRLPHRVVAALAYEGHRPVAAALALTKGQHLYGRYWGPLVPVESLHFELCYYQLIEYAIVHGLSRFEAGAQGEHKLKRGFLPSSTFSAHWIRHEGLAEAVADFLQRERAAVEEEMAMLAEHSPFHRAVTE